MKRFRGDVGSKSPLRGRQLLLEFRRLIGEVTKKLRKQQTNESGYSCVEEEVSVVERGALMGGMDPGPIVLDEISEALGPP